MALPLGAGFSSCSGSVSGGPAIAGVAATNVEATGATITWTTNEASDSQVDYGTTAGYGQSSPLLASPTTTHSVALSGLTPSTAYHFRVRSKDAQGRSGTSGDFVFTTASTPLQLEIAPPVGGFTSPLDLQEPADGSGRLFVVEQGGRVRIIQSDGQLVPAPFIDIATRPGFTSGGETGLLGLAFHPNYAANGRFYVNYTRYSGAQLQTVIAEFTASPPGADTASPASERILFTVDQPFTNHNGGGLAFGPDGFLYIGLGDGGSGGDPFCNAQNLDTLLGKMLRIDVNGTPPPGGQYVVPSTNPFANQPGERGEIWLYGLRNPFRFSFDLFTGDLYIGDVGQNAYEEVDLLNASQGGANLGWNLFEGTHPYSSACTQTGNTLTPPIFDYSHANGDTVVTGGYVYRGTSIPSLAGTYVFGDFGSGRVWTLAKNEQGQWVRSPNPVLTLGSDNLSSFGETQHGELYVVRYSSGEVARIREVGRPTTAPARETRVGVGR